jgi:hypothetical protein
VREKDKSRMNNVFWPEQKNGGVPIEMGQTEGGVGWGRSTSSPFKIRVRAGHSPLIPVTCLQIQLKLDV